MRQSFINGITNAMGTQALNLLYDNYNVNPSTGGGVTFIPGKGGINAQRRKDQSAIEQNAKRIFEENQGSGMTWAEAIRLAGGYSNDRNTYPDPTDYRYPGAYEDEDETEEQQ